MFGLNKWILIGVGVVALGAVSYHFYTTSSLNSEIARQTKIAADLRIDNDRLKLSNESLEKEAALSREAQAQILAEVQTLRQQDAAHDQELSAARAEVRTAVERLADYAKSPGSTDDGTDAIVKAINKQLNCRMANVGRAGGKCVDGIWKVN